MSRALVDRVRPELRALEAYKTPLDPLPIKLDANESPFELPPEVRAELGAQVAGLALHRYPDLEVRALRAALAGLLETSPERLLLGAGSDESIQVLLMALARPRAAEAPAIVLPDPSFAMYAHTARVLGLAPVHVPLVGPDFALDVPSAIAAIHASEAVAAFFASPNNPTGVAYDDASLFAIARACPEAMIVIDEAYGIFREPRWGHRRALGASAPNVVFLGTLSKVGLAALRIGWIEADPALVHELDKARLPYDLPGPTQALGAAMLTTHRAVLLDHAARIVAARERLGAALRSLAPLVRPLPSAANFFLVEARGPEQARALHAHLAARGIQVRGFREGRLASHLRITVGAPRENDALVRALELAPEAAR